MKSPAKNDGRERSKLRVLLAEQSPAVRHRFRKKLQELPAVEIVGEAARDNEALELSFRLQPQVLVVSASLPDQGGFEVLRRVKRSLENCQVILMSHRPCSFIEKAGGLLGAAGVCPIEDGLTQLCDLVQGAMKRRSGD
jgi:DNA-binding NarL/FixJ family response regulator